MWSQVPEPPLDFQALGIRERNKETPVSVRYQDTKSFFQGFLFLADSWWMLSAFHSETPLLFGRCPTQDGLLSDKGFDSCSTGGTWQLGTLSVGQLLARFTVSHSLHAQKL